MKHVPNLEMRSAPLDKSDSVTGRIILIKYYKIVSIFNRKHFPCEPVIFLLSILSFHWDEIKDVILNLPDESLAIKKS